MPIVIKQDIPPAEESLKYIRQGWDAAIDEKWLEDNPYPDTDWRHGMWCIGYRVCPYSKGSFYLME
jgi:hypothetical protein